MTKLLPGVILSLLLFACASETEEEEAGQSDSALKCPSPIEDKEGFARCVKKRASKNGKASSSQNGGNIQIGDIDTGGNEGSGGQCSNVTIRCDGNGPCSCECTGKGCREVCCP